ncbi:serine hydrolase domain-containing protein [Phenylobacterium sp.]|uniref:serine hydrolase domain-containing protein n=1 Tax=Phenylobacterium sp. TaxID=1871053 RepID=UPI0025F21725|nr:serine hydrolase domain-containing protein [Phenylobacterium sp.]
MPAAIAIEPRLTDLAIKAAPLLEVRLAKSRAPALAAAVVNRNGVVWSGAAGVRRRSQETPVSHSDRWHLGSNTKAMTAALFARLVQAELARWDAPLPSLFPGLRAHPAWEALTIADLLRHRSGLRDRGLVDAEWIVAARSSPARASEQRSELAARALEAPPRRRDRRFAYANANYVIAGAAIERITGQTWEDAMRTWLIEPLGMSSAGFGAPRGDQPWGHPSRMAGFGVGPAIDPQQPEADNPAFLGPAGTAHMSLNDHARFVRLFLADGAGFLTRASIGALTTPPTGEPNDYAFGWGVIADRPWAQGPVLLHEGSNTLWHSVVIVGPQRGLAVLTAANAAGPGGRAAQGLALDLLKLYAGVDRP